MNNNLKNTFCAIALQCVQCNLFGTDHACLKQQEVKHWKKLWTVCSKTPTKMRKKKYTITKLFVLHTNKISC